MTLHIFSATRLGRRLAAGAVAAPEQAFYIAGTSVVWLLPGYLFIVPPIVGKDPAWFFGMWFYEFAMLAIIFVAGTLYCLGKCRVEPTRHFLIDFSCLSFPLTLTTLVAAWALNYAIAFGVPWGIVQLERYLGAPSWFDLFFTDRFLDLLRFFAVVGSEFAIFYRMGRHMERVADLRATAPRRADMAQPQRLAA
jgi:hypothetical protein